MTGKKKVNKKRAKKETVPKKNVATRRTPKSLADLNEAKYNPRDITSENFERLGYSMKSFGDLSGIVFNVQTKNLVAGHQRKKSIPADADLHQTEIIDPDAVGTVGYGYVEAFGTRWPVRYVDWPVEKEKAANIAANSDRLQGVFTLKAQNVVADVSKTLGTMSRTLQLHKISIPKTGGKYTRRDEAQKPEVEITPELYESHNYLVLYFDNELDWQTAKDVFGVAPAAALDSKDGYVRAGTGRVIPGASVIRKILEAEKKS